MPTTLVRAGLQYAWRGPSLLIASDHGSLDAAAEPLHGFYYREARFLSRFALTINGERPWLCEGASIRPDLIAFEYVHPEISAPGGGGTGQSDDQEHVGSTGLPERALAIHLSYRTSVASLRIDLTVSNHARHDVAFDLRCALDADFADLLEAQSGQGEQQAHGDGDIGPSTLTFIYRHQDLPYRTVVNGDGGIDIDTRGLAAPVELGPGETRAFVFEVTPHLEGEDCTASDACAREARRRGWAQAFATIEIPGNTLLERIVSNNVRDIASFPSLGGPEDEWLAPPAGMPLYPAFFGRDAVTGGWQMAMLDRGASLEAALTRLGRMQATIDDPFRDAEPGRIP